MSHPKQPTEQVSFQWAYRAGVRAEAGCSRKSWYLPAFDHPRTWGWRSARLCSGRGFCTNCARLSAPRIAYALAGSRGHERSSMRRAQSEHFVSRESTPVARDSRAQGCGKAEPRQGAPPWLRGTVGSPLAEPLLVVPPGSQQRNSCGRPPHDTATPLPFEGLP